MKKKTNTQPFPFEVVESRVGGAPLYKVVLLNDDFTPMEFVQQVLEKFFGIYGESAKQLVWKVHKEGKGICGIYTHEIAETKAIEVKSYARDHDYPLKCQLEEA